MTGTHPDAVVIGAGIIGAACAYYLTRAGVRVCVVDRAGPASGTSGACEGNILVSDKQPGPELDLAVLSHRLWQEIGTLPLRGATAGVWAEMEPKGGLVVASDEAALRSLQDFAHQQAAGGAESTDVPAADLTTYEPNISPDLAGGRYYPRDMQVHPSLATAAMLRLARDAGARVEFERPVTAVLTSAGRVTGVRTPSGDIAAGAVVNAAGTWAGKVAALAGADVPIAPRRGFLMVTEPLPRVVRRKVYLADYVADVASDSADLQASAVVEGTASGTVLIGATRERVEFDRTYSPQAVRTLAEHAIRPFPFLRGVSALRAYRGFRPYSPDHLPVIGADLRVVGLWHACGHEGAGIGLATGTGHLVAQAMTGATTDLPLRPYRAERFAGATS